MVLAAGYGTRLEKLGLRRPKPLLPVCGVELARFALAQMAAGSIRRVVINLHHKGSLVRKALGDGSDLGMALTYSLEEGQILGTGGGIRKVRWFFGDNTFVVMNGKIVSDLDLRRALEQGEAAHLHRQRMERVTAAQHVG